MLYALKRKLFFMKLPIKLIALFCALFAMADIVHSQSLSMGFEAGTGISYIGENDPDKEFMQFDPSVAMGVNLKFTPKDSYFGLRLNIQHVNTHYNDNSNWPIWGDYYGEISTTTSSLLLEHLNTNKKWNFGYNFGMGVTQETYEKIGSASSSVNNSNFMSISGGGIVQFNLGEKSALYFSPSMLWTDPINTLYKNNWVSGREDIAFLFQLGYSYKLQ